MVKIVNTLGDFKTGKQGEAVYQGKYGEQIRRTLSPKRAIVSEAQDKHRQLYRDALTWRKSLSLANRRYLEGYCIANWVVDGFNVPLPWHRFALKLHLQRVKFIPSLATTEVVGEEAVDQQYTTGDTSKWFVYNTHWAAQTFTPSVSGQITKVKLKLYRSSVSYDFVVSINTTNEEGRPTATILCSKTYDSEPITTDVAGEWYEFSFDTPATLTKDVLYAIVLHGFSYPGTPTLYWREDFLSPEYFRGYACTSVSSGDWWSKHTGDDNMFQTFAFFPGEKITYGTLVITHPALLRIVQKRGEHLVNGHDNLSSLDDEYLTSQVKLEVEAGDVIEAITIAVVSYKFAV